MCRAVIWTSSEWERLPVWDLTRGVTMLSQSRGKNPRHVTGSRAGRHIRHLRQRKRATERGALKFLNPLSFVYLSMERRKKKLLSLTLFRLVVPILAELPVVVLDEFVVDVLGPALGPLQSLITLAVVLVAVEALVPQGEEVTGSQLLSTSHAHETLQPDNFMSRPLKRFVG